MAQKYQVNRRTIVLRWTDLFGQMKTPAQRSEPVSCRAMPTNPVDLIGLRPHDLCHTTTPAQFGAKSSDIGRRIVPQLAKPLSHRDRSIFQVDLFDADLNVSLIKLGAGGVRVVRLTAVPT